MTEAAIELASAAFAVEAPREILDTLQSFYPTSLVASSLATPAARFAVRSAGQKWELTRDGRTLGSFADPLYALLALEFEIEMLVIASTVAGVGIHAGGVVTDQGAWLIAGNPDTGKTSSTFVLLELEQRFLCEEIALYDPDRRSVSPHLQTLALDNAFLRDYESSFDITSGRLVRLDDAISRFVPRHLATASAAVGALIIPNYQPLETPRIESVTAEVALPEFLGYCFPPRDGEETLFDAVIDLLENTAVYRVTYSNARSAREVYADLLAMARAPTP